MDIKSRPEQVHFSGRKTNLNLFSPKIRTSFRALCIGATQSGKTTFIRDLLRNENMFDHKIHCINYHYSIYQPIFEEMKKTIPNIHFYEGLPEHIEEKHNNPCIIVLDDLLLDVGNSDMIHKLFTVQSHHNDKSVILVSQSLFHQAKHYRTVSLNSNYIFLFPHPRDPSQIIYLGRQIFPHNVGFLPKIYHQVTSQKPFAHIMIDLNQYTKEKFRVWSDVLSEKPLVHYYT